MALTRGAPSNVAPGVTKVGWIGTGVMGRALAAHVLDAGYELGVFTRTRSKADPLLARGARWFDDPKSLAAGSDVVFTMLGFPKDVDAVVLGEGGVLVGARPGTVLVDMTTSEPALSRRIAEAAAARGAASVDAPVSGGDVGARNATLSIMVGGEAQAVEVVRPLLEIMGKTIRHHGPPGSGQHAKMVNQILVAAGMIGVCEALIYASRTGLDPALVIESVAGGAAGSWAIENLAPRIIKGDYAPGFYIEHFLKDIRIALAEARRVGLELPGLELAEKLYRHASELGLGRKGTQALYLAVEASGSDRPHRA